MTVIREPGTSSVPGSVFALVLSFTAACASQPAPRPAHLDPSNPAGPESPAAPVSQTLAPNNTPASPVPAAHDHAPDTSPKPAPTKEKKETAEFTCPMHPEVVSPEPGRCPKCGMKLLPKDRPEGTK